MKNYNKLTDQEWQHIESSEHDKLYAGTLPFDFKTYKIDPGHVIWWEDYCFKRGRRRDRGHRTHRLFELMDLNNLDDKVILDVGCGNGQYSVFFTLMGAKVYGFDISIVGIKVAVKIAQANGVLHRCHFSVQNAAYLTYPDRFFDIIVFHEVLHHAIKYPNVNEETLRVLKKGGQVICAENLHGNLLLCLGRFFTMRKSKAKGDVDLTLQDLKNFAKGFTSYEVECMSLLFMIKRIFKKYLGFALVRWFLFLVKIMDDVVLKIFPFMKRYCGECILVLKK